MGLHSCKKAVDRCACKELFNGILENFVGNTFDIPARTDGDPTDFNRGFFVKVANWRVVDLPAAWRKMLNGDFFLFFSSTSCNAKDRGG